MSSRDLRVLGDSLGLSGTVLLDRYQVGPAIALGGMAIIYRGRDLRLLRPVCIKVFHRLRSNDSGYHASYEHFIQEAFALSQFSHPNTLRIYDFGYLEADTEAPFQISEMLEGGTLGQLVHREGPRPPDETLEILAPVAGALAEAHARGIVHRDIKPSNILFGLAGASRVVKLCDFGIAKANDDDGAPPHRAEDTFVDGHRLHFYSPGWAAPEQARGEAVGPGADVFSLGLVTAFVLTGRPVFSGRGEDVIEARDHTDAHVDNYLSEVVIAPALAAVVRRACRASVELRFASVDELASALREAVVSITPPAMPVAAATTAFAHGGTTSVGMAMPTAVPEEPPAAPTTAPILFVEAAGEGEVLVAGRRMRLIPMMTDQLDLGGEGALLESPARFRITMTPSAGEMPRFNVKGLNCFVSRIGARPTTAVDVEIDMDLSLLAHDRRELDSMRCMLGESDGNHRRYDLGTVILAVPNSQGLALLDLGPGRALGLLHRGPVARRGGRR
mgnify:FL=1